MYKIELTKGSGWNPPIVETHSVRVTTHIAEVERLAQRLLDDARRKPRGPDGYRIIDKTGRCVKEGCG